MRGKRFISAAVFAAVVSGTMAMTALPAMALSGTESEFVSAHNGIRSQNGRRSLSVQSDLVSVARRHSGRMAAQGSIWHNPNLGSEVKGWTVVGENVGMGPGVQDLMDAFMDSPAHRANIVDPDYNQFGVGVVVSDGTIFVTVVFAKRSASTSTTVAKPKPASRPRTTTSRSSSVSRPSSSAPRRSAEAAPAAPPAPKPAAPPVRTVSILVRMVSMDN